LRCNKKRGIADLLWQHDDMAPGGPDWYALPAAL
jgi:hypothetical protein